MTSMMILLVTRGQLTRRHSALNYALTGFREDVNAGLSNSYLQIIYHTTAVIGYRIISCNVCGCSDYRLTGRLFTFFAHNTRRIRKHIAHGCTCLEHSSKSQGSSQVPVYLATLQHSTALLSLVSNMSQ